MVIRITNAVSLYMVLACYVPGVTFAHEADQKDRASDPVDRVLQAWKTRRESVRTARFVVRGAVLVPPGAYNTLVDYDSLPHLRAKDTPAATTISPLHLTFLFDFDQGQLRKERKEEAFHLTRGIFVPSYVVDVYKDGATFRYIPIDANSNNNYQPDAARHPELSIVRIRHNTIFYVYEFPILFGLGFVPCWDCAPHAERVLHSHDQPSLRLAETKLTNNTSILVLRSLEPQALRSRQFESAQAKMPKIDYEYWVDIERDCVIIRYAEIHDGVTVCEINTNYAKTEFGWVPDQWEFLHKKSDGGAWQRATFTVQEHALNERVPGDAFELPTRAGMLVETVDPHPEVDWEGISRYYRVSDDGKELIPTTVPDDEHGHVVGYVKVGSYLFWLLQLLIVVLVLSVLLLRRRFWIWLEQHRSN